MKKITFLACVVMFLSVLMFSCQEKKPPIALVDETSDSLAILQDNLDSTIDNPVGKAFPSTAAGESQRAIWSAMLTSCYASGSINRDLINSNLLFLGASSNMYLGTIVDKKLLSNDFDVKTELKYIIPAQDFKKFATTGETVNNCDLTKATNTDFSLSLFLSGVITQGMNDSLGVKLSHWDSIKVTSGTWQVDYIRESDFIRYLDTSKNEEVKHFRDVAFNNKNRIMTKVVKVTGFAANAFYKDSLAAGLQVDLANPVSLNVTNNSSEAAADKDPVTGKITFSRGGNKQVNISSSNSFYIFGNVKKGKKL